MPLARIKGNKIHYVKNQGNERIEVTVRVQHTAGGVIAIECEKCPGLTPNYFITLRHPTYVQGSRRGVQ